MNQNTVPYKMPPEWEKHQRSFVSWPVKESVCYPENYETICEGYREIIEAIACYEPVSVIINKEDEAVCRKLFTNPNITVLPITHNDAWIRDNGPTFVRDSLGKLAGINWIFNAWGEKYPKWEEDNLVASQILDHYKVNCINVPIIMEGGSFHTDGDGTLLTTEECLLNQNRNKTLTKKEIEESLQKYLGIKKVIWLKQGLSGDETDGHVDNVACFARPGEIIMQVCDDRGDENYEITKINLDIINKETDAMGRKIKVIPIKQPPKREYDSNRLTLSYLNFYFVNGGIVLPVFGDDAKETDIMAEEVLKKVFPDRKITKTDGMKVVTEGGNVHCTTQQMPV